MDTRKLEMDELGRKTVEEYKKASKTPVILILDNIRSLHNVGSVFRTSDAFLLQGIYLCGMTGRPPHRDIRKTALGATDSVAWEYFENTSEAIQKLKEDQFSIWAVEQVENSTSLAQFYPSPSNPLALIFGNEMNGVSDEALAMADGCIEIPQFGTKHSLNISVSVGVVLWDLLKKAGKFQTT